MRYFNFYLIPLVLCSCNLQNKAVQTEDDHYEVEEINIDTIQEDIMVDLFVDSCVFVDQQVWPDFPFESQLSRVLIVEYQDVRRGLPPGEMVLNDSLITERFERIAVLDSSQILEIKRIFHGYKDGSYYRNRCYEPRHCIYFLDNENRVLSYVEVCFACEQVLVSHGDYFKIECNKQLDTLKYLFKSVGMTKFDYGH